MDYQHATTEDHRQFLTGRLRALEVEHNGYQLLLDNAPGDDPQRPGWEATAAAVERNIRAFRKGLEALEAPTAAVQALARQP